jgi:hypothetical protein
LSGSSLQADDFRSFPQDDPFTSFANMRAVRIGWLEQDMEAGAEGIFELITGNQ